MPKGNSGLRASNYEGGVSDKFDGSTKTYGGWREAFEPDFLNESHFQQESKWYDFSDSFGNPPNEKEARLVMRDWTPAGTFGYIATGNSFDINKTLYDPNNVGKSDEELFQRVDEKGVKRDLQTVQTLNRMIDKNRVPANAIYTRYSTGNAIKATFNLNGQQMEALNRAIAGLSTPEEAKLLNDAMRGTRSYSRSYTSTSANSKLNVFQSYSFVRKLYTPAGTKAFPAKQNLHESEVVFGRGLETEIIGVSVDRHKVILHERVLGYKKR